jgi:hypothetical protein
MCAPERIVLEPRRKLSRIGVGVQQLVDERREQRRLSGLIGDGHVWQASAFLKKVRPQRLRVRAVGGNWRRGALRP